MDDTLEDLLSVQPLLLTKEVQQILQPQEQEDISYNEVSTEYLERVTELAN